MKWKSIVIAKPLRPGQNSDFQASTNLRTWQDLGTNTADPNGQVQFLDTNAPNYPYRFYVPIPR